MSTRRSRSSFLRTKKNRRLREARKRENKRQPRLESLEDRRLLAIGPQLIGVQPNDGALLPFDSTDIRNVGPRDLTFRFDRNQIFDPNMLEGIQITRSNKDQAFAPAEVSTDFNTNGAVEMRFFASRLGQGENGITLNFSKSDQGTAGLPVVSVLGNTINISLNTNQDNETTAEALIAAIERNIDASALIMADVTAGDPGTDITSQPINFSPLVLDGANDIVIQPGFVGLGDFENEIIVRFAEPLPDDLYQIDIYGEGKNALRNAAREAFNDLTDDGVDNGASMSLNFDLDLGALVTAVVPQPVTRLASGALQHDEELRQIVVLFQRR